MEANCEVCKKNAKVAVGKCVTCQKNVCGLHFELHKDDEDHVVEEFKQLAPPNKCRRHPSEDLTIVCLECNTVQCSRCLVEDGHGRKYISATEYVDSKKTELKSFKAITTENLAKIKDIVARAAKEDEDYAIVKENCRASFQDNIKKAVDMLLSMQKERLEAFDTKCVANETRRKKQLDNLCNEALILEELGKQLDYCLTGASDIHIAKSVSILEGQMRNYQTGALAPLHAVSAQFKLEIQVEKYIQAIEDQLLLSAISTPSNIPRNGEYGANTFAIYTGLRGLTEKYRVAPKPLKIAVDADDNIYITMDRMIGVFQDRQPIRKITVGCESSDEGQPFAIAIDQRTGVLIVSEQEDTLIQLYTPTGNLKRVIGNDTSIEFTNITSIALDNEGNIIVADGPRIVVVNQQGEVLYEFGSEGTALGQFSDISAIGVDKHGNIYIADVDCNRIQKFSKFGHYISKIDVLKPMSVRLMDDDNLVVLSDNQFCFYGQDGAFQTRLRVPDFDPTDVVMNSKGHLVGVAFTSATVFTIM